MATADCNGYTFDIYDPNTPWADIPGVYIFAGARKGRLTAFYIGICDSLKDRLVNHKRWNEAVQLGATRIHVRIEPQAAPRQTIERALIGWAQPPLNTHHK